VSDHALDVNEPVDPVEAPSAPETIEQDVAGEAAEAPSESSPEQESRAQKRIRELTFKQREAERRAAAAEAKAAELEKSQSQPPPEPEGLQAPVESDYEDPAEYRQALDAYTDKKLEARLAARESAQNADRQAQAQRKRIQSYMDQCAEYAANNPEFGEDVAAAQEAGLLADSPHVVDYMTESDRAAELTHYLAKNPEHAQRIEQMSPVAAARELAKVELALGEPKTISKAPSPMSDVEDGQNLNPNELEDGLSVDEWMARRRRSLAGR